MSFSVHLIKEDSSVKLCSNAQMTTAIFFQAKASSNSPVYSGSDQELRELDPKLENLRDSDSDSDDDDDDDVEEGWLDLMLLEQACFCLLVPTVER